MKSLKAKNNCRIVKCLSESSVWTFLAAESGLGAAVKGLEPDATTRPKFESQGRIIFRMAALLAVGHCLNNAMIPAPSGSGAINPTRPEERTRQRGVSVRPCDWRPIKRRIHASDQWQPKTGAPLVQGVVNWRFQRNGVVAISRWYMPGVVMSSALRPENFGRNKPAHSNTLRSAVTNATTSFMQLRTVLKALQATIRRY